LTNASAKKTSRFKSLSITGRSSSQPSAFPAFSGLITRKTNPFESRRRHFFAELCNTVTRQPIELESCSNPLRIRKSSSSDFLKIFGFGFEFFVVDVTMAACFLFGQVYLALGANPTSHFFVWSLFGN